MKRILLTILLLFALVGNSLAADKTVYVSPAGSNTSPYDTWEKAANLATTAITYLNSQTRVDHHTLYIAPGTYSGQMSLSDADMAYSIVQGTAAHGSTAPAAPGQVTITHTADVLYATATNITVNDITFQGSNGNAIINCAGANGTFNRCHFYDNNAAAYLVRLNGCTGAVFNRCKITGKTGNCNGVTTSGTAPTATFNYCLISGSVEGKIASGVYCSTASASITLNNCDVLGIKGDSLYASAGTVTATNCVVNAGDSYGTPRYCAKQSSTGTITVSNSILIHDWQIATGEYFLSGTVTDTNNIKTKRPGFTRHQKSAIVIPCVDDSSSYEYAGQVATVLATKGVKGTWYVNSSNLTGSALTQAQTLAAGTVMEIGSHCRTHNDLTLANSFSVAKSSSTIAVDRAADTITLSPGGTVTGFKEKTIGTIVTELTALGATCTNYTALTLRRGESLADLTATSCDSALALQNLLDTTTATGMWKDELVNSKSEIEAALGITVRVMATPFGSTSTNLETAAMAAGYESMRVGMNNNGEWLLNSIDLAQVVYLGTSLFIDATEEVTKRKVYAIAEQMTETGGILFLLAHSTAEATAEQWGWVLDALAEYSEITVTSHSGALDIIKASPWTTADSRTYTRAWTDLSNCSLVKGSAGIDAGQDVGLTTDYAGNPIKGLPDIGAYEFQGGGGGRSVFHIGGKWRFYSN